ncbi:hypothetical protein Tco_1086947, partial [Tanacetum coccineum]
MDNNRTTTATRMGLMSLYQVAIHSWASQSIGTQKGLSPWRTETIFHFQNMNHRLATFHFKNMASENHPVLGNLATINRFYKPLPHNRLLVDPKR